MVECELFVPYFGQHVLYGKQSRRLTEIKSVSDPILKNILFDILLLMDFGRAARTRLFKLH
jgi:hypothetical protein